MNGNVLAFVRDAIVGGRVMTQDNEKHHIQHNNADFDAVSLYPSAQAELDGYFKENHKWFRGQIPPDADYYIARVKLESIGKPRHFPLLNVIEFQDVKVSIMEGIYWNEGFNNQIVTTIKSLFGERLKLKKEGNPLQNGIKLLMNSAYGKLIQKPIVKQKVMISDKVKSLEYTNKNIHKMISRTPITDHLALFEEYKSLSEHFSPAHLGVQVLDSSKHIMNRVMCLAEDIDAKIWYQDTDSMHIDYDAS
ncbi:uncharacterized protein PITG_19132 [Phytophthora infestans T30-4]|uniref:Uncharacterized protein n=1 Tax=Phytophthora infestans (strain T30-4) TaxID=403677 RepID=D0NYX0_PHYIT|nr:uncharacterized protein PITG_19132 [Phytophthora infestans T30-4]EEY68753.1 conserved hypothetical protein [Phytophthora infestans T30-4]|eukprot:XP_002997445.1 conserved hypothetical protein [Phytophthora infestans T30-4]